MFYLLELREKIKKLYQDNEIYCTTAYRFIVSFIVFFVISKELDYNNECTSILVVLFLAVIGAFVPSSILVLLSAMYCSVCVFFYSPIIAAIVVVVMIILYCLFIRFTPGLGYAVLGMPILFALNMPCFIPMVLGLTVSPAAAVSVACGTIVYYLFKAVKSVENVSSSISKEEAIQVYEYVMREFVGNKAVIFSTVVFFTMVIIVYIIRTRKMAHSFEAAIVTAGIFNMLVFLIGNLNLDTGLSVLSILFGTIFAGVLAYGVQFFRCVLDYSAVENVQFEDDDYYYYVKAVPKVKVSAKKNDVKKITEQKTFMLKDVEGFGDELFPEVKDDIKKDNNKVSKKNNEEDSKKNEDFDVEDFDIDDSFDIDIKGFNADKVDLSEFEIDKDPFGDDDDSEWSEDEMGDFEDTIELDDIEDKESDDEDLDKIL